MEPQLELPGNWLCPKNSVERLLQEHHLLVTFIGAAIVLATFIVKDAVRESVRNLIEASNAAEAQMLTWQTTDSSARHFESLLKNTNVLKGKEYNSVDSAIERSSFVQEQWARERGSLSYVGRLIENLPIKEYREKELKTMQGRLAELRDKANILSATLQGQRLGIPGQFVANISGSVGALEEDSRKFAADLYLFEWEVLESERTLSKSKESCYRVLTWTSYFLFTLGWILALIGRIYGVQSVSDQ